MTKSFLVLWLVSYWLFTYYSQPLWDRHKEWCPFHRQSNKGSKERQRPTLGVRFTEVPTLLWCSFYRGVCLTTVPILKRFPSYHGVCFTGVPLTTVSILQRYPSYHGVCFTEVSHLLRCPFYRGVHLNTVFVLHRCPLTAVSILQRCPSYKGARLIKVSLDRVKTSLYLQECIILRTF